MPSTSRQVTEWIDRPATEVYDFVSDPANLPRWAHGLGSAAEHVDGRWYVETGSGRVHVAFAEPNAFGVLDHEVTLPTGEVFYNPMRGHARWQRVRGRVHGPATPGTTDDDFERDAGLVQADLTTLKRLMEGTG
jgi:hypothetical protein